MCVCVCVCMRLPIKRLQVWRQPWLLLFALFIKRRWADGLLVCCAVHTCRRAHTHTQIHIHTCMFTPVTLALSSIYLFHYTSLGRTMLLGEGCVCVHVCVRDTSECERVEWCWMKSQTFLLKTASEVVIWKADDSFTHSFTWVIAIHLSATLRSRWIACNRGIVLVLHHSLSACVQEMAHCTFKQGCMSRIWPKIVLAQQTSPEQCEMCYLGLPVT